MLVPGIYAGIAVLLAAVGVYGVMSYSVSRRAHEVDCDSNWLYLGETILRENPDTGSGSANRISGYHQLTYWFPLTRLVA